MKRIVKYILTNIQVLLTRVKLNHFYLRKIGIPLTKDLVYQSWLYQNYPSYQNLVSKQSIYNRLKIYPVFSLLISLDNTKNLYFYKCIESVINQIYPYWEICIAGDLNEFLKFYTLKDKRIKFEHYTNHHVSHFYNNSLALASGDFVGLLYPNDLLSPHTLLEFAILINKHPEADFIYSDEDKVDKDNYFQNPYFKPAWSPDTFLSKMYTSQLGIYRTDLIKSIGGFCLNFEGSEDYDLVLRLTEITKNIFHIPQILYHSRIYPSEVTSIDKNTITNVNETAKQAIQAALVRRGEIGKVYNVQGYPGNYIVRYNLTKSSKVSIIIPSKDQGFILDNCLSSIIFKSTYDKYEIILIDNNTTDLESIKIIEKWKILLNSRLRIISSHIPFNYSKLCNFGVDYALGDYLLFLNNDTEVITCDWIEALLSQSNRSNVGVVGVKLLYPDYTIQHAGIVLKPDTVAEHYHRTFSANSPGYNCCLKTVCNYSAVTGACLMIRRDTFSEVDGFDEKLPVAYNDVDLCLKVLDAGYYNVYIPYAELLHYESKSRKSDNQGDNLKRLNKDKLYLISKWSKYINHDPFYSSHLNHFL